MNLKSYKMRDILAHCGPFPPHQSGLHIDHNKSRGLVLQYSTLIGEVNAYIGFGCSTTQSSRTFSNGTKGYKNIHLTL